MPPPDGESCEHAGKRCLQYSNKKKKLLRIKKVFHLLLEYLHTECKRPGSGHTAFWKALAFGIIGSLSHHLVPLFELPSLPSSRYEFPPKNTEFLYILWIQCAVEPKEDKKINLDQREWRLQTVSIKATQTPGFPGLCFPQFNICPWCAHKQPSEESCPQ